MSENVNNDLSVDNGESFPNDEFVIEKNKKLGLQFSQLIPDNLNGAMYSEGPRFAESLFVQKLNKKRVEVLIQNKQKSLNFPDPPFQCVIVRFSQGFIEEEDRMQRNTTRKGYFPQYFLGSNNQVYETENYFCLSADTGKAVKIECIIPITDSTIENWGNEGEDEIRKFKDVLPKIPDFESPLSKDQVDLDPSDYEKLGNLLMRVKLGELK